MTAITDANTFIDQNLINVPYQGVPATTLNACLKTITNVFNSYATIASVNSLFGYALDGNFPAALMNAPNQAFTLNGGYVSISALLLFSSGQKYTVGPDGNYILNAANGPAWDWSTGRRRLLIEAIGSTNYWNSSEGTPYTQDCTVATTVGGFGGALARQTVTVTATSNPLVSSGAISTAGVGSVWTLTLALRAGSLASVQTGIYGAMSGWGASGDATGVILSGPGTITRNLGAFFLITDLSATEDTIIRITRTILVSETLYPNLYCFGASSPTVGNTFSYARPQFEPGYGSSYIVSGASPTARAADVVTAASGLLALLTAANATLVMRGSLAPGNASWGSIFGGSANCSVSAGGPDFLGMSVFDDGANVSIGAILPNNVRTPHFGIGVSKTSGLFKTALNGGVVASGNLSFLSSSNTIVYLGYGPSGAQNIYLDEFGAWPILASDAGLQAQARVYS